MRLLRRGGRVVEGARLESVYTETYRGFKSLPLRQLTSLIVKTPNSKKP